MSRRDPRSARVLGLWTAGWLAVFLLVGMVRLGEPTVQWPVLAVPVLWALVALRPRRQPAGADRWDDDLPDDAWDDPDDEPADRWSDRWPADGAAGTSPHRAPRVRPRPAERTDTVERPALRRPSGDDPWSGGRRS